MPQVVFRSIFAILFLWIGPMVWAETPVRLDLGESYVTDRGQGIEVQLCLNRATAYGLRLRDNPMRLIVDLAGIEAQNLPNGFDRADRAQAVTLGPAPRAGWGRLSLNLTAPMVIERAVMDTGHPDAVRLTLRLRPATAQEFATHLTPASADEPPEAVIAEPAPSLRPRPLIALDPRNDALADALVTGLEGAGVELHSRPRLEANFTVLRAPDYPSVLLEIRFMSEGGDLENILDPIWRARA